MNADYLWDRSGQPDPFIVELEAVLAPLAHKGRPLTEAGNRFRMPRRLIAWAAAAAAVALAAAGVYWLASRSPSRGVVSWTIAEATGDYRTEPAEPLKTPAGLETGQWVRTGAGASVRLHGRGGGAVVIGENSRVRLVDLGRQAQRLELVAGTFYTEPVEGGAPIEVITRAAPAVIAPGTACLVRIMRDERDGVEVKVGRVEFLVDGRPLRLSSGCSVAISEAGVGTPHSTSASPALTNVLAKYDEVRWKGDSAAKSTILQDVLRQAQPGDEVTLWNLMWQVDDEGRKRILQRARAFSKSLFEVEEDGLLHLERAAMEDWWGMIERR